jgi:3'-phosphoadenosine 5'-phosphosulfate sulfotransferase (PAPS reductase)/FAD synthetase
LQHFRGDKITKHIVSLSGGKDSTAMLLMMIEKNMPIDEIIFCDTGMEFPEIYAHISKIEKNISRKITVLKYKETFEHMMLYKKRKNGKIGWGWCGRQSKWAKTYFKIDIYKKYLNEKYKNQNLIEYHGLAADEVNRINKNKNRNIKYPLIEWGITEQQALQYCYSKGFNWNGLYEKISRTGCWCCQNNSLKGLEIIYKNYPDKWQKLKEWQKIIPYRFRNDYTVEELEHKFEMNKRQMVLF